MEFKGLVFGILRIRFVEFKGLVFGILRIRFVEFKGLVFGILRIVFCNLFRIGFWNLQEHGLELCFV